MSTEDQNPQVAELKTQISQLTDLLSTQKSASDARANETERQLAQLNGQLSVLLRPTTPDQPTEIDPQTMYADPQKVLDEHFAKRAKPFLDAQAETSALTQRELLSIKRGKDWVRFQKEVDEIAARMSKDVLARPGTYEGILDVVASRHKDEIIKEEVEAQVKEQVAKFQAEAARTATASTPGPAPAAQPKAEDVKFEDQQLAILKKFGIDPKRAAEVVKDTATDGVLITGPGGVH